MQPRSRRILSLDNNSTSSQCRFVSVSVLARAVRITLTTRVRMGGFGGPTCRPTWPSLASPPWPPNCMMWSCFVVGTIFEPTTRPWVSAKPLTSTSRLGRSGNMATNSGPKRLDAGYTLLESEIVWQAGSVSQTYRSHESLRTFMQKHPTFGFQNRSGVRIRPTPLQEVGFPKSRRSHHPLITFHYPGFVRLSGTVAFPQP